MWIPSRFDVVGSYGPPSQDDVTGHASVTSARYLETRIHAPQTLPP